MSSSFPYNSSRCAEASHRVVIFVENRCSAAVIDALVLAYAFQFILLIDARSVLNFFW